MPTYVGLGQQGFYEPWRLLGEGLRAYQNRKVQREQMAQQQGQFDKRLALDQAAENRAQQLADVTVPLQQLQLGEAQRLVGQDKAKRQFLGDLGSSGPVDPTLMVPWVNLTPQDRFAATQMFAGRGIDPAQAAQVHNTAVAQMTGRPIMPQTPPNMRISGATLRDGQVGDVELAPNLMPLQGGAGGAGAAGGIPTHPGTDVPTFSWAQDPSGKFVRIDNPNPRTAQIAAFKHVQSDPVIQKYADQAAQFNLLKSGYDQILAEGESGMKDVNLIYNFVKSVDPGSVVREGEVTIIRSAMPALKRIATLVKRFKEGVQLDQKTRDEIYAAAISAIEGSQKAAALRYKNVYLPMYGDQLPPEAEGLTQLPPSLQVTELPNSEEGLQQALQMPNGSKINVGGVMYVRDDKSPKGIVPAQ